MFKIMRNKMMPSANVGKAANDLLAVYLVNAEDRLKKLQKVESERVQRDRVTVLAVFTRIAKAQTPMTKFQIIFLS
jgi:hypothetical protein